MQIPYRKPPKFSEFQQDPLLTQAKFDELQRELKRLQARVPAAAADVSRLAQNGDFSENAEYQHAKGRLRGINHGIVKLQYQLDHAEIIKAAKTTHVSIGHTITVESAGRERIFHILGSAETDPANGVISYTSPIGAALMDHEIGDEVVVTLAAREVTFKILKIE